MTSSKPREPQRLLSTLSSPHLGFLFNEHGYSYHSLLFLFLQVSIAQKKKNLSKARFRLVRRQERFRYFSSFLFSISCFLFRFSTLFGYSEIAGKEGGCWVSSLVSLLVSDHPNRGLGFQILLILKIPLLCFSRFFFFFVWVFWLVRISEKRKGKTIVAGCLP
jgi:hypothetical protein